MRIIFHIYTHLQQEALDSFNGKIPETFFKHFEIVINYKIDGTVDKHYVRDFITRKLFLRNKKNAFGIQCAISNITQQGDDVFSVYIDNWSYWNPLSQIPVEENIVDDVVDAKIMKLHLQECIDIVKYLAANSKVEDEPVHDSTMKDLTVEDPPGDKSAIKDSTKTVTFERDVLLLNRKSQMLFLLRNVSEENRERMLEYVTLKKNNAYTINSAETPIKCLEMQIAILDIFCNDKDEETFSDATTVGTKYDNYISQIESVLRRIHTKYKTMHDFNVVFLEYAWMLHE